MMKMNVQKRRPGSGHALPQRGLYVAQIVEPYGIIQVDNKMSASAAYAVASDEMIVQSSLVS